MLDWIGNRWIGKALIRMDSGIIMIYKDRKDRKYRNVNGFD